MQVFLKGCATPFSIKIMEEKKQITNKEAGAPEEEAGESMSFWDHLEVLRWAIFRIACFLCVCMVGTFIAMPYIFDNYILAPTSNNFFVYQWLQKHGHGLIQERNINTGEMVEFEVSGDKIEAVHMIPGWTHNIINLSDTEDLVTVMTCNEVFDPNRPDTFFEVV